ncbi:MAG: site-specific integrase [Pirellulales bacterium]|nr:site-specific integrase [Pirellulales bacterium]
MPKLIRTVPTYQKHRASGQAVVSLNGRDFYLGPHGTKASRIEYDRLIGEWLRQGRQIQPDSEAHGLTVVELLAAYLHFANRYYRTGNRPTTEIHAIRSAMRGVKLLYGRKPCSEFGPIALQAVMQRMSDDGLARTTINQHSSRIKRMFRWGVSQELIPAPVYQALASVNGLRKGRSEARETNPVLPVDDITIDATLPHLPDVIADMIRLQRLTGMRPAELCQLRPIDLHRSADVWIYKPSKHKTAHQGKERVVFIGPQAQDILLRYLARDPQAHCFRPCDSEAKRRAAVHAARKTPLSCGTKPGQRRKARPKRAPGDCYSVASYRRAIARACDVAFPHPELLALKDSQLSDKQRAELRQWQDDHRWAPNQLRHTAATDIRRQFGLEAAQITLGHSQANTTQIYAERDMQKGIEVARRIG